MLKLGKTGGETHLHKLNPRTYRNLGLGGGVFMEDYRKVNTR